MEEFQDEELDKLLGIIDEDNEINDSEKVDKIMQKIFEVAIPKILQDVNEEEKQEMQKELKKKINYIYRDSIKHLVIRGKEDEIDKIIEQIITRWNKKTIDDKRMDLLRDEAAENIISNSNVAWKMASERLKTGKIYDDEKLYNEMIEKFEKNKNKVKEFNIKKIEESISEGILDLKFAFGKTENTSLRIGRYK